MTGTQIQSGKSFRSYVLLPFPSLILCSPLLSSLPIYHPHIHPITRTKSLIKQQNPSLLGIPPSKPTPKDSVLVIVDAQNEYDHGLLAISDVKASRAVIGDVLGRYREVGGDVVSE